MSTHAASALDADAPQWLDRDCNSHGSWFTKNQILNKSQAHW